MNKPQDFAKAGIDSVSFFGNTMLDGIERVAALNLSSARSFIEASFANLSALQGAKDVQSFVSMQKELAAPTLEKGMAYSRNVYAIATETKEKMAKEVATQVATETKERKAKEVATQAATAKTNVEGLVEKTLAAAPAGSEAAVAAVKSAIKTANEAYEGLNKAAKQATEVAQASVVATVEAARDRSRHSC